MECLTFRRTKLAAPHSASPELAEHVSSCEPCAAFARELETFEQRLQQAARVEVPDGLAEQIILRHRRHGRLRYAVDSVRRMLSSAAERRGGPLLAYAAFVTLALAVTLSVGVFDGRNGSGGQHALADSMIAHVASEPSVLDARDNVEPVEFDHALARYGAQVEGHVGEIRHLGECVIEGVVGQHIVVETPYGIATLLLMPERAARVAQPRTREGYTAIVVPLRGGSLGIVADSPEKAVKVEQLIERQVKRDL
jgi:hypothetical protein